MKMSSIRSLYEAFDQPFAAGDASRPSSSIISPSNVAIIPPPLIQAGSSVCPELKNFPIPEVSISYLPGAILTESGVVIYDEKHIIAESVEGGLLDNGLHGDGDEISIDLSEAVDVDEVVLAICRNGTWNYSLFISEIIPLAFVSALNTATLGLRIPMLFRSFMTEQSINIRKSLLNAVGVSSERLFKPVARLTRYSGVVFIKANERYTNHRVSQLMPSVAGRLKSLYCDEYPTSSRRIYISRQSAPSRKVTNYSELFAEVLQPFGLEPIELENLDLKAQVDLFSKADLVVSEHGAGLVNTMFMRPGATVIEITPNPMVGRWMYRMIAHYSHLNYGFGAFATPQDWTWNEDDYSVPCRLYKQLLSHC